MTEAGIVPTIYLAWVAEDFSLRVAICQNWVLQELADYYQVIRADGVNAFLKKTQRAMWAAQSRRTQRWREERPFRARWPSGLRNRDP